MTTHMEEVRTSMNIQRQTKSTSWELPGTATFLILGLNHRTASLALRQRFTIQKEQLSTHLERLLQYVEQGVILSTCNRLEIYTYGPDPRGLACRVREFLVHHSGVASASIDSHLYQYQGSDAVRHLLRVASGLDSMVVGEKQILGQVRSGYNAARQTGSVQGPLARLFDHALQAGRHVHRDSSIGGNSRSVSQAGVHLAIHLLGNLSQRRALVIGAGDAGQLVARGLADAGVKEIVVTNRTYWRAAELAQKLGGTAVPFEELCHQLAYADVVISCTGSPSYVMDQATMQEAIAQRDSRSLLIIDIAVPSDIDPAIGKLDNVELYDIDALQLMVELDSYSPKQELSKAEAIIAEEMEEFLKWWCSPSTTSLLTQIREQAEQIRRAEVAFTIQKLDGKLPPDATQYLDALTSSLVKKLLHHPTMYIKKERLDSTRQQLVRELFNVDGGSGSNGRK